MKLIRKATNGDVTRLFKILVDATTIGCAGYYPEDIISDWHRGRTARGMTEVLLSEIIYVLQDEEEIRGYVHLKPGEIVGLFVDPGEHGKGYGKDLLKFALKEIQERPVKILATLNAVDFYTHFGLEKGQLAVVRRNERDIYVWEMQLAQ